MYSMDEAKRLITLARTRISDARTHWEGCERDHRECLIQRMADELERIVKVAQAQRVVIESLEHRVAQHTKDAAAIKGLDSEREANALLTKEIEQLRRDITALMVELNRARDR